MDARKMSGLIFFLLLSCHDISDAGTIEKRPSSDTLKAAPKIPETLPKEFAHITYQADIIGADAAGVHRGKITVAPNYAIRFADGVLFGGNRGEWGGELVFRDNAKKDHFLLDENVQGIFMSGSDAIVFTGILHLHTQEGAIHLVKKNSKGEVEPPEMIRKLSSEPNDIVPIDQDTFVFNTPKWAVDVEAGESLHCFQFKVSLNSLVEIDCMQAENKR